MDVLEFVISIVAMVLGAITLWILLLRKSQRKSQRKTHAEAGERYNMNELSAMAESMQDRIGVLESILDAEVPDWREQNEHRSQ
jgi:phage shock protein B